MNENNFEKNKHLNRNKHIAIHPSTKYQSIRRNPDCGTRFAKKA